MKYIEKHPMIMIVVGISLPAIFVKYFTAPSVVTAIMAGFLFGEMPVLLQVTGGIMIIGGVYYYSRIEKEE